LVEEDEQLTLLDAELEEVNSVELEVLNVETAGDKILVSERSLEERPEGDRTLRFYSSELEELDAVELETRMLYSFDLVETEDGIVYSLLPGTEENKLLEVNEGRVESYETEASGEVVYVDGLYTVGDKVQRISTEGEIEEELDLEVPRMIRPVPEPVPR